MSKASVVSDVLTEVKPGMYVKVTPRLGFSLPIPNPSEGLVVSVSDHPVAPYGVQISADLYWCFRDELEILT